MVRGWEGKPADNSASFLTVLVGVARKFVLTAFDRGEAFAGAIEDRSILFMALDAKSLENMVGEGTETALTREGIAAAAGELTAGVVARMFALFDFELVLEGFAVCDLFRRRAM